MHLNPSETALVVVDIQNGFCHPDGSLYAPGSEAVLEPIASLINQASPTDTTVIFTKDVHPPQQFEDNRYYNEFDRWGEHVLEGTWDAQIHESVPAGAADHIVVKHTYDAFYRTDLTGYLDAHGIHDLVIVGTLANVCVLHTAGSAGLRDFRPILVEDAIGALGDDHKSYALEHAEWLFGEVVKSGDIDFVSDQSE